MNEDGMMARMPDLQVFANNMFENRHLQSSSSIE
jgi:hypothetical protein